MPNNCPFTSTKFFRVLERSAAEDGARNDSGEAGEMISLTPRSSLNSTLILGLVSGFDMSVRAGPRYTRSRSTASGDLSERMS